ncbi:MAG: hypothetical protein F4Z08_02310 [Chloroflexi bacterium]|nr:hypothetical protein [Chloroflexota bacterium]
MARVLIDMLPDDDLDAAQQEAARVSDPRAAAFHDAEKHLGRSTARRLGWERHVAWDIFLVYGPGAAWTDADIPPPDDWFHQLNDGERPQDADEGEREPDPPDAEPTNQSEADPARYRTGEDLLKALADAIRSVPGTRQA